MPYFVRTETDNDDVLGHRAIGRRIRFVPTGAERSVVAVVTDFKPGSHYVACGVDDGLDYFVGIHDPTARLAKRAFRFDCEQCHRPIQHVGCVWVHRDHADHAPIVPVDAHLNG